MRVTVYVEDYSSEVNIMGYCNEVNMCGSIKMLI